MAIVRRPRFQRFAVAYPFQLTTRDIDIIRRIARHRFLNSVQITQLVSGSHQQTLRRLQALYHHGYLDRPRCQIDHFHQLGTKPMVYGVTRRGARVLNAGNDVQAQQRRWTLNNAMATRMFLDHTLQVADVMIAFELACRRAARATFVRADELSLTSVFEDSASFRWNVSFAGEEITVIPDAVFALDLERDDGRRERVHYFLEADRGTMPVIRKKLRQTSLLRKLLAYEATWSQGVHRAVLGIDRFRVLTVTTNRTRVEHLRGACSRLQRGHGLFLFTDLNALRCSDDLFSLNWSTAKHSPATGTLLV
ncbi:MAG TPA: replication-relaxation family protein [Chthoniobacterales bacterium]|jgi:hypothetical protein